MTEKVTFMANIGCVIDWIDTVDFDRVNIH